MVEKQTLQNLAEADLARSGLTLADVRGAQVLDHIAARAALRRDREQRIHAEGAYSIPYYALEGAPLADQDVPFLRLRLLGAHDGETPRYLAP